PDPARRRLPEDALEPEGGRVTRRADHRRDGRPVARARGRGVGGARGASHQRAADARRADDPAPTHRRPRRRVPRDRRRPAAEPREERYGRVANARPFPRHPPFFEDGTQSSLRWTASRVSGPNWSVTK